MPERAKDDDELQSIAVVPARLQRGALVTAAADRGPLPASPASAPPPAPRSGSTGGALNRELKALDFQGGMDRLAPPGEPPPSGGAARKPDAGAGRRSSAEEKSAAPTLDMLAPVPLPGAKKKLGFALEPDRARDEKAPAAVPGMPGGIEHFQNSCFLASALNLIALSETYRTLFNPARTRLRPEARGFALQALVHPLIGKIHAPRPDDAPVAVGEVAAVMRELMNQRIIARMGEQNDASEALSGMVRLVSDPAGRQDGEDSRADVMVGSMTNKTSVSKTTHETEQTRRFEIDPFLKLDVLAQDTLAAALERRFAVEHPNTAANFVTQKADVTSLPKVLAIELQRPLGALDRRFVMPQAFVLGGNHYRLTGFVKHLAAKGHYVTWMKSDDGRWFLSDDIGAKVEQRVITDADLETARLYSYELQPGPRAPGDADADGQGHDTFAAFDAQERGDQAAAQRARERGARVGEVKGVPPAEPGPKSASGGDKKPDGKPSTPPSAAELALDRRIAEWRSGVMRIEQLQADVTTKIALYDKTSEAGRLLSALHPLLADELARWQAQRDRVEPLDPAPIEKLDQRVDRDLLEAARLHAAKRKHITQITDARAGDAADRAKHMVTRRWDDASGHAGREVRASMGADAYERAALIARLVAETKGDDDDAFVAVTRALSGGGIGRLSVGFGKLAKGSTPKVLREAIDQWLTTSTWMSRYRREYATSIVDTGQPSAFARLALRAGFCTNAPVDKSALIAEAKSASSADLMHLVADKTAVVVVVEQQGLGDLIGSLAGMARVREEDEAKRGKTAAQVKAPAHAADPQSYEGHMYRLVDDLRRDADPHTQFLLACLRRRTKVIKKSLGVFDEIQTASLMSDIEAWSARPDNDEARVRACLSAGPFHDALAQAAKSKTVLGFGPADLAYLVSTFVPQGAEEGRGSVSPMTKLDAELDRAHSRNKLDKKAHKEETASNVEALLVGDDDSEHIDIVEIMQRYQVFTIGEAADRLRALLASKKNGSGKVMSAARIEQVVQRVIFGGADLSGYHKLQALCRKTVRVGVVTTFSAELRDAVVSMPVQSVAWRLARQDRRLLEKVRSSAREAYWTMIWRWLELGALGYDVRGLAALAGPLPADGPTPMEVERRGVQAHELSSGAAPKKVEDGATDATPWRDEANQLAVRITAEAYKKLPDQGALYRLVFEAQTRARALTKRDESNKGIAEKDRCNPDRFMAQVADGARAASTEPWFKYLTRASTLTVDDMLNEAKGFHKASSDADAIRKTFLAMEPRELFEQVCDRGQLATLHAAKQAIEGELGRLEKERADLDQALERAAEPEATSAGSGGAAVASTPATAGPKPQKEELSKRRKVVAAELEIRQARLGENQRQRIQTVVDISPAYLTKLSELLKRGKRVDVETAVRERIGEVLADKPELLGAFGFSPLEARIAGRQTRTLGRVEKEHLLETGAQYREWNNKSVMRSEASAAHTGDVRALRADLGEQQLTRALLGQGGLAEDPGLQAHLTKLGKSGKELEAAQKAFENMRATYDARIKSVIAIITTMVVTALSSGMGIPAAVPLIQFLYFTGTSLLTTCIDKVVEKIQQGDSFQSPDVFDLVVALVRAGCGYTAQGAAWWLDSAFAGNVHQGELWQQVLGKPMVAAMKAKAAAVFEAPADVLEYLFKQHKPLHNAGNAVYDFASTQLNGLAPQLVTGYLKGVVFQGLRLGVIKDAPGIKEFAFAPTILPEKTSNPNFAAEDNAFGGDASQMFFGNDPNSAKPGFLQHTPRGTGWLYGTREDGDGKPSELGSHMAVREAGQDLLKRGVDGLSHDPIAGAVGALRGKQRTSGVATPKAGAKPDPAKQAAYKAASEDARALFTLAAKVRPIEATVAGARARFATLAALPHGKAKHEAGRDLLDELRWDDFELERVLGEVTALRQRSPSDDATSLRTRITVSQIRIALVLRDFGPQVVQWWRDAGGVEGQVTVHLAPDATPASGGGPSSPAAPPTARPDADRVRS